jgi:hypothetical protein
MSLDIDNRLLPTRSLRSEYAHARHDISVKPGVTPAHCRNPDFWVHLAAKFRLHDVIEIIAEDGSFEMDLRVIARDSHEAPLWVRVRPIRFCGADGIPLPSDLPDAPEVDLSDEDHEDGYKITFHGPHKFTIQDRFGNAVEERIATKALAREKLAEIRREKMAA